MPPKGSYAGKILRVDLSTGKVEKKELDPAFAHKHIGGRGFASWYLYNEVPPEVSPFDPANRLIFTPGALFGTAVPAASRTTATSKSPVTGMFGDGHSSGHWGAVLKSAGYDMLLLQGAAEKPVYLWIDNDRVELRDAAPLWGKGHDGNGPGPPGNPGTARSGRWLSAPPGKRECVSRASFPTGSWGPSPAPASER